MSSLALTSGWYYICTSYCTPDKEISILGVVVERGEVQMENDKVKAVKEWKTPIKVKEVKSFLEFINFY